MQETNYSITCKADVSKSKQVQTQPWPWVQQLLNMFLWIWYIHMCLPADVHVEAKGWHGLCSPLSTFVLRQGLSLSPDPTSMRRLAGEHRGSAYLQLPALRLRIGTATPSFSCGCQWTHVLGLAQQHFITELSLQARGYGFYVADLRTHSS